VHYDEVEKAVRDMAAAADAEHRRRFGTATVIRLTSDEELASAAEVEFDEDARQAFAEACTDPVNSTPDQLHSWLERMDAGTLSDGDMDPLVLLALQALDHWAGYLVEEDPEFIAELAIRSIEEVDYQVSASLDDFLGTPEMAAEFARISTLLGATT
jgi:hypothetical protein